MNPTDPNTVLQAIQTLANQGNVQVPVPTIPTLAYTAPNLGDLDTKYKEFLNRAANDPDIINYYNQLLQQAEGDTNIARNFLEQDYQTGTRNILSNLQGSLKQLGLTSTQEQQAKQDELNRRGIALTQEPGDKVTYAGGGEAKTELGQLTESQNLRQEAEQRSASQGVTGLSQSLQKGLTSTGQQLTQRAQELQQQKESAIGSRAGTYYGFYQSAEQAKAQKALQDQQNQILSSQAGTGGAASGDPTKMTQDQRQSLWTQYGHAGQAPVGYGGG